jgi:ribosome-associated toxin RatA of RatAB toxin-antitoxin module
VKSTVGIDIAAPADVVFRLARDVERWPQLLPHYVAARAIGARTDEGRLLVAFIARRPLLPVLGLGLPVAWRALTWSETAERRLRFVHRGGATAGMDVTWRIDDVGSGASRVEIEHLFRPRVPGWAWLVDRAFTRPIAGRTLATFRTIAEALATPAESASAESAESAESAPTNPSA